MNKPLTVEEAVSLLMNPPEDNSGSETPQADDDVSQASTDEAALEEETEDAVEEEEEQSDYEDDDDDDEPEPDDSLEVIIDGERQRVTRDEAAKGYQRQADYTRKSQDLAKQRKALAAESEQIAAEREKYAQALAMVQNQLASEEQPDWSRLRDEDPFEYMVQKDAWRDKQERLQKIQAEQQRIAQQQAAEQQQAMQQELANQRTVLLERIPAWKDQTVAEKEKAEISAYARKAGFTDEEIAAVSDARAVELLHKAWQYDKLMSDQKVENKRVKKAPKAAKSGQPTGRKERTSRQRQAAFDKLKSSGSINDAVDYLLQKGK